MNKYKFCISKLVIIITFIISVCMCIWLVAMEQVLPSERDPRDYELANFNDGWFLVGKDGTRSPFEVPGSRDVEDNEIILIEKIMPDEISANTWICFRTSRQDMHIYINGVLREHYSTAETRPFGLSSVSSYLFFELEPKDAKKTISVEIRSDSTYNGVVRPILYGDKMAIFHSLLREDILALIFVELFLVLGIGVLVLSVILKLKFQNSSCIVSLGLFVILLGLWLLTQSKSRQFFFSNVSVVSAFSQFILLLLPLPFASYINGVQKYKYGKWYLGFELLTLANFFINTSAIVLNLIDQTEATISIYVLLGSLSILVVISLLNDLRNKRIASYRFVAYGFTAFLTFGVLQMFDSLDKTLAIRGYLLCCGVVVLTLMSSVQALSNVLTAVHRQQKALCFAREETVSLQNKVVQTEHLVEEVSIQAMTSLVQTIEAKDPYTKGHSTRVAEYSMKLAKALGMSEQEQQNIYCIGLLHDIGKIGVPDSIITKPSRLTDDEFTAIKQHPSIGFQILKNMATIPGIEMGARWHHERLDGTGYPDKLVAKDIPLLVRIISVADAYDAMASKRSYRDVLSDQVILKELENAKGTQFDPVVIDAMIQLINDQAL